MRKSLINWLYGLIIIVSVGLCLNAYLNRYYTIEPDFSNLIEAISDFDMRGRGDEPLPVIELQDAVTIGQTTHQIIEIGSSLGCVELKKNIWGKYAIDCMRYGSGDFGYEPIDAGGRKYLLFYGRDDSLRITGMSVVLDDVTYTAAIEPARIFVVCMEIDRQAKVWEIDLNEIRFFDGQGVDITQEI